MTPDAIPIPPPSKMAARWAIQRTFSVDQVPSVSELKARKDAQGARISVGLPALNEAATIGPICRSISQELMGYTDLVDDLVVLDGSSVDETALRAEAAGAHVVDVSQLMPQVPPYPGKGDSLWRSLTRLPGDIIVWIDADIRNFQPHFITRLVAPLLMDPGVDFVKGFYERPIEIGGVLHGSGGGRVTELLARPLLDMFFPELGGFVQPLAGEYAGRADALRRVPFFSGYSVEVGLLIDLLDAIGLDGMAQIDLGTRIHRNRPLEELTPMAYAIGRTILRRAEERGRIKSAIDYPTHPLLVRDRAGRLEALFIDEVERPPIALVPPYLEALADAGR